MTQNELIQTFFSPDKFIVERKYNNTFSISTIDDGTHCFTITLDHDKIIINSLDKCGITGNESLTLIDELSKIIPDVEYIELLDLSELPLCDDIGIDLAILKILTNGQSWYNSHNYFSDYYTDEIEHNKKIINMKYNEFINKVYDILKNKIDNRRHIEQGNKLFPNLDNTLNVKDYYNKILDDINSDEPRNKDKCKWLSNSIEHIVESNILKYDRNLVKIVKTLGGKNNKKTRNKKTRNKKTRNKKTHNKKTRNKKTRNKKTRNKKTHNKKTRNKKTRNKKHVNSLYNFNRNKRGINK